MTTPPVLAVLPFRAVGGETEADYFADGVTEDIITALSRFRSFTVLTSGASFAHRDRAGDPRALAAELAVRYLLMGSVRRAGDRLRISAQLVEGDTGTQLWAEHFDGALADIFEFQDRITEDVAMVVEPRIQMAEIERSRRERPGSVAAYDIYLQALPKIARQTAKENAEAYELLTRALAIEPDNALLLAEAGWALGHRNAMGWPPIGPDDVRTCTDLARRAPATRCGRPDGHGALRVQPAADRQGIRPRDGGAGFRGQGPTRTTTWWWSSPASRICTAARSKMRSPIFTGRTG